VPSSNEQLPTNPVMNGNGPVELDTDQARLHQSATPSQPFTTRKVHLEPLSDVGSTSSTAKSESSLSASDPGEPDHAIVDTSDWNFQLPVVQDLPHVAPGLASNAQFSTRSVIVALQQRVPYHQIEDYFGHHGRTSSNIIRSQINDPVDGFPPIFYATATNDDRVIRIFAKHGASVDSMFGNPAVSLLAFAVIHTKTIQVETTMSVATLLSLGADASTFPKAFYSPFYRDLPETGPEEEELDDLDDPKREWCRNPDLRSKLAETLNLTQRYHLEKSSRLAKPSDRQRQIARRNNCEALFGVPYFMIGQTAATDLLRDNLLHHMLRHQVQPLVLVFAGMLIPVPLLIAVFSL
jgi:hypothetical protein